MAFEQRKLFVGPLVHDYKNFSKRLVLQLPGVLRANVSRPLV